LRTWPSCSVMSGHRFDEAYFILDICNLARGHP
jgi:hypothetical protein